MKIKIKNYKSKYKFQLGQIVKYQVPLQTIDQIKILGIIDADHTGCQVFLDPSCSSHPLSKQITMLYLSFIAKNDYKNPNPFIGYIAEFPKVKGAGPGTYIGWCHEHNFYEI